MTTEIERAEEAFNRVSRKMPVIAGRDYIAVRFKDCRLLLKYAKIALDLEKSGLVEVVVKALDFAWDELTDAGEDDSISPINHWCGFLENPESGYCQFCDGIGGLQELREALTAFQEARE